MVHNKKNEITSPLVGESLPRTRHGGKGEGFVIKYRMIKYPRIEFKTGKLNLILPKGMCAQTVIIRHKNWINEKSKLIAKYLKNSNHLKIINRPDNIFRKKAGGYIKTHAGELNTKIHKIFYRNMRTKWASCSARYNITLNSLLKYLPKRFIEYVVYHELMHIHIRQHNQRFWNEIEKKFINHNKLEFQLFSYWFLLQKKISEIKKTR